MNLITTIFSAGLLCAQTGGTPPPLKGTVAETLDAGNYTYIRVTAADGDHWAAVPKATLKTGAKVEVQVNMIMDKFDSPTLHRAFNGIAFGTLAGAPHTGAPHGNAKGAASPKPGLPIRDIKKAEGPDGLRVADVYSQKDALKGKTVAVRGRIVKYNAQIMGANWIHLQDGSGSAKGKDDDIAVTTQDNAAVGDVVTARGTVGLDKDIGAGYFFPVLIEKASLSK